MRAILQIFVTGFSFVFVLTCTAGEMSYSPYVGKNYPMNVYWGDTHLHTLNSPDAGLVGNTKLGPAAAFRFARGDTVVANNGMRARLKRPLDFLVVTDHAEYLGIIPMIRAGNPTLLKTKYGRRWHDLFKGGPKKAYQAALEVVNSIGVRDEKIKSVKIKRSVWSKHTRIADRYNQPGKFTADWFDLVVADLAFIGHGNIIDLLMLLAGLVEPALDHLYTVQVGAIGVLDHPDQEGRGLARRCLA